MTDWALKNHIPECKTKLSPG